MDGWMDGWMDGGKSAVVCPNQTESICWYHRDKSTNLVRQSRVHFTFFSVLKFPYNITLVRFLEKLHRTAPPSFAKAFTLHSFLPVNADAFPPVTSVRSVLQQVVLVLVYPSLLDLNVLVPAARHGEHGAGVVVALFLYK